jgi:hypothetical protein
MLQPSPFEKRRLGQHLSSNGLSSVASIEGGFVVTAIGAFGQVIAVQVALLFKPLHGHIQVFNPSPAGNAISGVQRSEGRGKGGQRIFVQLESRLRPVGAQEHVLHWSSAVKRSPGQHLFESRTNPSFGVVEVIGATSGLGASGQVSVVHTDSFLKPLHGQLHVLSPSPAG